MALEKPTRGKPIRERYFIIGKFTTKLRNFQTNLSQLEREFLLRFPRQTEKKSNSVFFLCSLPRFLCCCMDSIVRTSKTVPSFFSRKSCPEICLKKRARYFENHTIPIVRTSNKCYCPLLDLRAANFFLSISKKETSFLSSLFSLQSAKVRQNAFPMPF